MSPPLRGLGESGRGTWPGWGDPWSEVEAEDTCAGKGNRPGRRWGVGGGTWAGHCLLPQSKSAWSALGVQSPGSGQVNPCGNKDPPAPLQPARDRPGSGGLRGAVPVGAARRHAPQSGPGSAGPPALPPSGLAAPGPALRLQHHPAGRGLTSRLHPGAPASLKAPSSGDPTPALAESPPSLLLESHPCISTLPSLSTGPTITPFLSSPLPAPPSGTPSLAGLGGVCPWVTPALRCLWKWGCWAPPPRLCPQLLGLVWSCLWGAPGGVGPRAPVSGRHCVSVTVQGTRVQSSHTGSMGTQVSLYHMHREYLATHTCEHMFGPALFYMYVPKATAGMKPTYVHKGAQV